MARYRVMLERRSDNSVHHVMYESPDYRESWVGARTVCRMGTLFKDDPRCKSPSQSREFYTEDGEKFAIGPAAFTVRNIFAENTRKTGKQRMTVITKDDVLHLLEERKIAVSKKLREALEEVLSSSEGGGLRVTSATARKLGLQEDEVVPEEKSAAE